MGSQTANGVSSLTLKARCIRQSVVRSLAAAGSGHLGGSMSSADILTALYFSVMKHKPEDPFWAGRDRFILSIGHIAPVLYATLAEAGYFPKEELLSLRKMGSRLQGHPGRDHGLPGMELSAGSLGQGLSVAVGMALAARLDGLDYRVYCLNGDGELQEGSIWEAVRPSIIIAKTIMGKGIPSIEGDYRWHGKAPSKEQAEEMLKEVH